MKVIVQNNKTGKERTFKDICRVNIRNISIFLWRRGKSNIQLNKEQYNIFVYEGVIV